MDTAGGLIGVTLKPNTVAKWAFSLHACSRITDDVSGMKRGSQGKQIIQHKEEMHARGKSDATGREKLRAKLSTAIDPFWTHPAINLVTGRITGGNVNVDKSISIGTHQMQEYESLWPECCYSSFSKKVITLAITKKTNISRLIRQQRMI
ncbi:hypothetical protein LSH36_118g03002 [Paralvinella palmiformis]|uniref:Uncharacterized protein n=1 Tax=Paralvinella palmiformis TaxID=53620 RepID=A0AAD9N8U0_9ANNE|nr:hypothetical protein LSH36_118g03002 [Paralvinella palmiformis]